MNNDIILSVRNVSRRFEMYEKPSNRLKQMLFGWTGRKWFKEFWALRDISFDVRRGECIGIIGRNGAGKSTMWMRMFPSRDNTNTSISIQNGVR